MWSFPETGLACWPTEYREGGVVVQLGVAGVARVRLGQHRHKHRDGPEQDQDQVVGTINPDYAETIWATRITPDYFPFLTQSFLKTQVNFFSKKFHFYNFSPFLPFPWEGTAYLCTQLSKDLCHTVIPRGGKVHCPIDISVSQEGRVSEPYSFVQIWIQDQIVNGSWSEHCKKSGEFSSWANNFCFSYQDYAILYRYVAVQELYKTVISHTISKRLRRSLNLRNLLRLWVKEFPK